MTIKEFILTKTLTPSSVPPQQSKDTTARLLGSPKNAKRLREAISSKTPKRLVFEATEDLKRALGIEGAGLLGMRDAPRAQLSLCFERFFSWRSHRERPT